MLSPGYPIPRQEGAAALPPRRLPGRGGALRHQGHAPHLLRQRGAGRRRLRAAACLGREPRGATGATVGGRKRPIVPQGMEHKS